MDIIIKPVVSPKELKQFVILPWRIYRNDPHWVPPLVDDMLTKLNPQRNPFWRTAERSLWIAWYGKRPVGRIAAILDKARNSALKQPVGEFGFFECFEDAVIAELLLETAADWLRQHGMTLMRGPYNPSPSDEIGILVEGFDTRPALMEAHNPPYYPAFFETNGFSKYVDTLARLARRQPGQTDLAQALPEKLVRTARLARKRSDITIRKMDLKKWDSEIKLACRIYNAALAPVPDFTPISEAEFLEQANALKPIFDAELALVAEVGGKPAGFALALPDINEAFQHVNGRLGPLGMAKLWWFSRKMKRVSFKILMVLPEFQNRGVEALLVIQAVQAIWDKGYVEVDMSLTGEENEKSTRFQEHLGMQVYRRYRIYEKSL